MTVQIKHYWNRLPYMYHRANIATHKKNRYICGYSFQLRNLVPSGYLGKLWAELWWQMRGFWIKRDWPPLLVIMTVCGAWVWMGRGV